MVEGEFSQGQSEVIRSREEKEKEWLPYNLIAEAVDKSTDRLRWLLNNRIISGEKRLTKTRKGLREKWWTSVEKANKYFKEMKLTPSKAGKKPPRLGRKPRGRPRKREAVSVGI